MRPFGCHREQTTANFTTGDMLASDCGGDVYWGVEAITKPVQPGA